nr:MAG: hypothetical protein [Bacteriophage sp.]
MDHTGRITEMVSFLVAPAQVPGKMGTKITASANKGSACMAAPKMIQYFRNVLHQPSGM